MTNYIYTEDNLVGTLDAAITATATTSITMSFTDRITGSARTPLSTTRLFTIDKGSEANANPKYEQMYAADGFTENSTGNITLTSTNLIRGAARSGSTFTAVTANKQSHSEGAEVGCSTSHFLHSVPADIFAGVIGTGNAAFKLGDLAAANQRLIFLDDQGTPSEIRKNNSSGKLEFSDDGAAFSALSTVGAHGTTANLKDHTDVNATATDSPSDEDLFTYDTTNKWANQTIEAAIGATKTEITQLSGTTNIGEADTFFGSTNISGAEAETLTDGSNADALHVHTGNLLASSTSDVNRANTSAEGDLINETVPANTLSTGNVIRVTAWISAYGNGTATHTFRLDYDGTTAATAQLNPASGTEGKIVAELYAAGATNAQEGVIEALSIVNATSAIDEIQIGRGTASKDSTGALTLQLTHQMDSADAARQITMSRYMIEVIAT